MSVITCRSNQLRGAQELSRKRPAEAFYNYVGGQAGAWEVTQASVRRGDAMAPVTHIDIINGPLDRVPAGTSWVLGGLVRNTRYVTRDDLVSTGPQPTNSPTQTCAALIPIRRSSEWWHLEDVDRRELLQPQSPHPARGLQYLSAMIRRWKPLNLSEQFDCVTWFEYEPRDSAAFDDLLAYWRASEQWKFVDRECDIRLVYSGS